jgi:hypothetical protein
MMFWDNPAPKKNGSAKDEDDSEPETENFSELVRFTLAGFFAGLGLGALLDHFGFQLSAVGGWLVRTVSGEGESIFEGFFALRQRLRKAAGSMAEAYGWGKLLGMFVPGFIDLASRLAGVNVLGIEGFYIPFFYSNSDQIGANISGLIYIKRREGSWRPTLRKYIRHPVMATSLVIVVAVPFGLLATRMAGFSPTTQVLAAVETIAANLCWLPPLVGWYYERKAQKGQGNAGKR